MLMRCINFMRGSVRIAVRGAGIERFLNVCAANGIVFWGVRRVADDCIEANVRIGGFFALRPYARKCMCRIRVAGKEGAPFYGQRFRRRRALLAGTVLCAALLWALSGFVWTIGIEGCENVTEAELLTLLGQNGLRIGVRTSTVDVQELRNAILEQTEELSYLAVNLQGSHAQVIVRERSVTLEDVDIDTPCDVVADKAGVVEKLIVRAGAAATEVGRTLAPGDLIAGGAMLSQQGETWLVHADAEVTLRTWRTMRLALPDSVDGLRETGEVKVRRALVIGSRRINLYFIESEPFACYDKTVERKPLAASEDLRFPVTLVTEVYRELERQPLALSEEKCAETMEGRIREMLERQAIGAEVTETGYTFEKQEGRFLATLQAECLESCGVQTPVDLSRQVQRVEVAQ